MKIKKIVLLFLITTLSLCLFIVSSNASENDEEVELRSNDPIYINNQYYSIIDPISFYGNTVYKGAFDTVTLLGNNILLITDDGIENNPFVYFDISSILGIQTYEMKLAGVETIGMYINICLWEEDDGNQLIYMRSNNHDLASHCSISHQYGSTPRIYVLYAEVDIDDIHDNIVVFHFDASGFWDDDWKFNYLTCKMYVTRTYQTTSSIINLGVLGNQYLS